MKKLRVVELLFLAVISLFFTACEDEPIDDFYTITDTIYVKAKLSTFNCGDRLLELNKDGYILKFSIFDYSTLNTTQTKNGKIVISEKYEYYSNTNILRSIKRYDYVKNKAEYMSFLCDFDEQGKILSAKVMYSGTLNEEFQYSFNQNNQLIGKTSKYIYESFRNYNLAYNYQKDTVIIKISKDSVNDYTGYYIYSNFLLKNNYYLTDDIKSPDTIDNFNYYYDSEGNYTYRESVYYDYDGNLVKNIQSYNDGYLNFTNVKYDNLGRVEKQFFGDELVKEFIYTGKYSYKMVIRPDYYNYYLLKLPFTTFWYLDGFFRFLNY